MAPDFLAKFRARSDAIRERWEALLRIEPISGPLANPDALVHLIPDSLKRAYRLLARGTRVPVSLTSAKPAPLPPCDCGNNPYLAYFVAGEQAMVETAVLLQAELPPEERRESDLAEIIHVARRLAISEIDAFCGICTHRGTAEKCRHATVAAR